MMEMYDRSSAYHAGNGEPDRFRRSAWSTRLLPPILLHPILLPPSHICSDEYMVHELRLLERLMLKLKLGYSSIGALSRPTWPSSAVSASVAYFASTSFESSGSRCMFMPVAWSWKIRRYNISSVQMHSPGGCEWVLD
jgi:hypothetical protein